MNPTIRAVTNPVAFRCKVDPVAFIRVPNRFAGPIHRLCASPKKTSAFMTLIFRSAKILIGNWIITANRSGPYQQLFLGEATEMTVPGGGSIQCLAFTNEARLAGGYGDDPE
jgi:hypothetical protein